MPAVETREAVYIGIDPGASGGIASVGHLGAFAEPTRQTDAEVWSWFYQWAPAQLDDLGRRHWKLFAVIERNTGYVGGPGNPGSAMFKFGTSYGALRMALTAAMIPFEEVGPAQWQKGLSIPTRKRDEKKGDFKNRLKAKAQQLFPHVKVTLATADALLIAEYCRRKQEGRL